MIFRIRGVKNLKKLIIAIATIIGALGYSLVEHQSQTDSSSLERDKGHSAVYAAYQAQQSDVWVSGAGKVVKVLADDVKGRRHQKFILELPSGITVLIAHNIDLAPRIPSLKTGDEISFFGEYEWNDKGGVIHWTHHDPAGRHAGGWLKHNGATFQ